MFECTTPLPDYLFQLALILVAKHLKCPLGCTEIFHPERKVSIDYSHKVTFGKSSPFAIICVPTKISIFPLKIRECFSEKVFLVMMSASTFGFVFFLELIPLLNPQFFVSRALVKVKGFTFFASIRSRFTESIVTF